MKNTLSQIGTLKQTTTLTPQQIQEIRILEYQTVELEERIEKEIEENPSLEKDDAISDANAATDNTETQENEEHEDAIENEVIEELDSPALREDTDFEAYISDDEPQDYYTDYTYGATRNTNNGNDNQVEMPLSATQSFQENLQDQLRLLNLSPRELPIAQYIVGNIGPDGYLRRTAESLVDDLAFKVGINIPDEEMEQLIVRIQEALEPAGMGARDLRECLLLQLHRKRENRTYTSATELAINILDNYFEPYTAHHYERILDRLNITEEQLDEASAEIRGLQPRPGNIFTNDSEPINTIIPDFIVEVENGRPIVMLNNGHLPELRINRSYSDALKEYQNKTAPSKKDRDDIAYVKDRIEAAKWFIDAIRKRNETMLLTMRTIVSIQRRWFLEGDDLLLKPMILKDVADRTGLDISTISRVSNSKYVQTPYGTKLLKHFFSESIKNEEGDEIATRAIKNALQEVIDNEDKRNPLRDDELVIELQKRNLKVARRTVAKYRQQLGIQVARLRKEL